MDAEFLDLFDRELKVLYEQGAEFAQEYPGVAERLGGLLRDRSDPMIAGLLEGAAFLAARVQLKMKHEFSEFTRNFLEQVAPHYLDPFPSALLAQITPPFGDPALREGRRVERGAEIEAAYREKDSRITCRYRLCESVTLTPFEIAATEYLTNPAAIQALGLTPEAHGVAGLRISLNCRTSSRIEDETADAALSPENWASACKIDHLTLHFLGPEADAATTYEQVFGNLVGVYLRCVGTDGDVFSLKAPESGYEQVGFSHDAHLLPYDHHLFRGFEWLREYFLFPRKFLGVRIRELAPLLRQIHAKTFDVVFVFNQANARMATIAKVANFSLYSAAAVNLFEMTTDRVQVRANAHEFQIIPDRSHPLDYEAHRVVDVYAHLIGGQEKVPMRRLYSAAPQSEDDCKYFYTIRRLPRIRGSHEKHGRRTAEYVGSELFISILEHASVDQPIAELSVRAVCSNRDLPERILRAPTNSVQFRFPEFENLRIVAAVGPTRPREPLISQHRTRSEVISTGDVTWRLISFLGLNHLGLVERGGGRGAAALREVLTLFHDPSDSAAERRISGLRRTEAQPVIRRFRQRLGIGAARGIGVQVTLDDRSFEGGGAFFLGAILDRFFAEYAEMNHFTETTIATTERGDIMRWPPRGGRRSPL